MTLQEWDAFVLQFFFYSLYSVLYFLFFLYVCKGGVCVLVHRCAPSSFRLLLFRERKDTVDRGHTRRFLNGKESLKKLPVHPCLGTLSPVSFLLKARSKNKLKLRGNVLGLDALPIL